VRAWEGGRLWWWWRRAAAPPRRRSLSTLPRRWCSCVLSWCAHAAAVMVAARSSLKTTSNASPANLTTSPPACLMQAREMSQLGAASWQQPPAPQSELRGSTAPPGRGEQPGRASRPPRRPWRRAVSPPSRALAARGAAVGVDDVDHAREERVHRLAHELGVCTPEGERRRTAAVIRTRVVVLMFCVRRGGNAERRQGKGASGAVGATRTRLDVGGVRRIVHRALGERHVGLRAQGQLAVAAAR